MEIYKSCKGLLEKNCSTTCLNSHTEKGYAQLQPGRTSVRPLETSNLNNHDKMRCARYCAQSQLERVFGSLPYIVDFGYHKELGSGQLQVGFRKAAGRWTSQQR